MLTETDLRLLHRLLNEEADRLIASAPGQDTPLPDRQDHARELLRVANCASALATLA
jgi:hypothetical protein